MKKTETKKTETVKELLIRLSKENSSSDQDARIIQSLLVKTLDYHACIITSGIVYLDGCGTLKNPPCSIHSIAKMICKVLKIS